MKNLLNFIVKYLYVFVFLLLQTLCFVLIFTGNNYHKTSYLNSSNTIVANVMTKWQDVVSYFYLRTLNDSLIADNERLLNRIEQYKTDNIPPAYESDIKYVAAKVVGANISKRKNYITINKGEKDGIKPDMGVIGANGIIGVVYSTSNNFATIMPVINVNLKISVKLKKNDYFGSLFWDGKKNNIAILEEIPGYVNVQKGDQIVTSGMSSMFPENISVGVVVDFDKDQSTDFYKIYVDLSTDFNNISYVYVVKNPKLEEYQNLIDELNEDND